MLDTSAGMAGLIGPEIPARLANLERALDRVVDFVAGRLGICLAESLSERVKELLAKDQFEVAVIEYRRETGAGLEAAFYAVKNGGKIELGTKIERLLKAIDREYPAQAKS